MRFVLPLKLKRLQKYIFLLFLVLIIKVLCLVLIIEIYY